MDTSLYIFIRRLKGLPTGYQLTRCGPDTQYQCLTNGFSDGNIYGDGRGDGQSRMPCPYLLERGDGRESGYYKDQNGNY